MEALLSDHTAHRAYYCDLCDRIIAPGDGYVRAVVPAGEPPNTDDVPRAMRWHKEHT